MAGIMEKNFMTALSSNSWDLFVFKDGEGQEYVSATLPFGHPIHISDVARYRASGPYMPINWPSATAVESAVVWMMEKRKQGFAFEVSRL